MLNELPDSLIEKAVIELKRSKFPILIWGGGQTARKIKVYMDEIGIRIDGFLINRKFWENEFHVTEGCPVFILEEYLDRNKCDLLVGFSGFHKEQAEMYLSNIHKLYALDFIGMLCLEGQCNMISQRFYRENKEGLQWLENCLCDEKSKKSLDSFITQKMSGIYTKNIYELDQYFPSDIIHLEENEIFVDCGAYQGESTVDFIMHLQRYKVTKCYRAFCVEADKYNVIKMKEVLKFYKNIEIVPVGVWDKECVLHMDTGLGVGSKISDTGMTSVNMQTIDNIVQGEKATYIEMDIEGSELKGLYGASNTIRKYKPKLAICIYHKAEDLIKIPSYIYRLRQDYKFYIRNHSEYGIETVLYAI